MCTCVHESVCVSVCVGGCVCTHWATTDNTVPFLSAIVRELEIPAPWTLTNAVLKLPDCGDFAEINLTELLPGISAHKDFHFMFEISNI